MAFNQMIFTLETALIRENELIAVEVEFGAYPDEFFINSVRPISITDEHEALRPCNSKAELLTTAEEDKQMLREGEAEYARKDREQAEADEQREVEASQFQDYQAWRRS